MENKEIITKVNEFLIDEFELEEDQLVPEASLKETLEIDSLDYVDLVVIIEKKIQKLGGRVGLGILFYSLSRSCRTLWLGCADLFFL